MKTCPVKVLYGNPFSKASRGNLIVGISADRLHHGTHHISALKINHLEKIDCCKHIATKLQCMHLTQFAKNDKSL